MFICYCKELHWKQAWTSTFHRVFLITIRAIFSDRNCWNKSHWACMLNINPLITYLTIITSTVIVQTLPAPVCIYLASSTLLVTQPNASSEEQDNTWLARLCKKNPFVFELGQPLSRGKARKKWWCYCSRIALAWGLLLLNMG